MSWSLKPGYWERPLNNSWHCHIVPDYFGAAFTARLERVDGCYLDIASGNDLDVVKSQADEWLDRRKDYYAQTSTGTS